MPKSPIKKPTTMIGKPMKIGVKKIPKIIITIPVIVNLFKNIVTGTKISILISAEKPKNPIMYRYLVQIKICQGKGNVAITF